MLIGAGCWVCGVGMEVQSDAMLFSARNARESERAFLEQQSHVQSVRAADWQDKVEALTKELRVVQVHADNKVNTELCGEGTSSN